ncbi:Vacuolar amino acid transporter 3 [Tolypocladium capitatum]|uniref:Vacuolar amino acid transporter 3 n=1 Tax=Tolypocladium capitatum TaxID=45235 RepID=A0A2K3QJN5_9HYPO|nr:Vacuolar amino acid transporter 3 [Tolypocladium capitatum]
MSSPRNTLSQPPRAASPAPGPRSFSSSLPRDELTARLAEPIPSAHTPTRSGSPFPGARPSDNDSPFVGGNSYPQGPGVSALAAALSNSLGQSPPRHGTPAARVSSPPLRSQSPAIRGRADTPTNYGSFDSRSRMGPGSVGPYEDPEIVKRHLVQPTESDNLPSEESSTLGAAKGKQSAEAVTGMNDDEFSSLRLLGGDVTRGIYKWTEQAEAKAKMQRSKSFDHSRPDPEAEVLDINSIKVPGGFRRNHLRRNARSPSGREDQVEHGAESPHGSEPRLFTSSFLEFLSIYGHFAGEELEEDDEVLGPNEEFWSGEERDEEDSDDGREPMEDSALLPPSKRKRKRKVRGGSGNNSPFNAALLLLKSFVGTGVLFLPRAYLNGGMMFSNLVLFGVAGLSYYCFVLLVTTRLHVEGSFGDMGGILYGKWMRTIILASIVISQIGFVAAYTVFTAENLQAFIRAVSDCKTSISIPMLILMQMVIFLPFSLLRDIGKLGFTALIADAFILIGLAYLFYYDVLTLSTEGLADIIMFNQKDWTLFIGTAIFTFEGIGLIIPIQESMKHPQKFPRVLGLVMIIITVVFITMGAISYAAYGSKTETVVLLNLPQDNKFVNTVQLLYSVAILLSTPLQIFPAIRIVETELFTRSGKYNPYIKWQKNVFRFFVVMLCAAIAWGGADHLDKFVALVGNFACIPLVYIYPPLLHYKAVARSRAWKISDIVLCIFGFVAMAYATSLTIMSWANSEPKPPGYCDRRGGL